MVCRLGCVERAVLNKQESSKERLLLSGVGERKSFCD